MGLEVIAKVFAKGVGFLASLRMTLAPAALPVCHPERSEGSHSTES
jgi:hypothetical protein